MKSAIRAVLFTSMAGFAGIAACTVPTGESSESSNESTQSAATTCSALYGQCGGLNWTGATCCTASTCTFQNPYYSQCTATGTITDAGSSSGGSSSTCPTATGSDPQMRAAASAAFDIMRLAAQGQVGVSNAYY
ncbi:MAG TPA: hypothetical protein VGM06_06000, partial [Polyangiaceae bacterium]